MAISPIGNITYVNQNSQLGSLQLANNMQKVDFMLNANMQEYVDKLKAVQEVSPAPQTEAINPDTEQQKKQEFQESESENSQEQENAEVLQEEIVLPSTHLLDIRA